MKYISLFLLLTTTTALFAQHIQKHGKRLPEPKQGDKNYSEYIENKKLFKRNMMEHGLLTGFGIPPLTAGTGAIVAGAVFLSDGATKGTDYHTIGIALVSAGPVLFGGGLAMIIIGNKKFRQAIKYKRKANELRGYVSFKPDVIHIDGVPLEKRGLNLPGLTISFDF